MFLQKRKGDLMRINYKKLYENRIEEINTQIKINLLSILRSKLSIASSRSISNNSGWL